MWRPGRPGSKVREGSSIFLLPVRGRGVGRRKLPVVPVPSACARVNARFRSNLRRLEPLSNLVPQTGFFVLFESARYKNTRSRLGARSFFVANCGYNLFRQFRRNAGKTVVGRGVSLCLF